MEQINELRNDFPETAKDLKLNLGSIFDSETLSKEQTWGAALTAAYFLGSHELIAAITEDAQAADIPQATIEDAQAAAAIMAMNTIYYRFQHMVGSEAYASKSPRLRMSRMAKPATTKGDFELFSMAGAVLAGCEKCIKAHEQSILKEGLSDEHVHEVVRIAATISGAHTAMQIA
ncbi:carboxymuconolactone decarboxylase family protein [Mucisphaera calidilacus]|uniref:Alkyl hydroperoxide reductase AhpD n=1 Tax=Mucisphaera calidilacus TaxID=2527982 RepID=A0A518BZF2_9BACT|nr:carboxymuconolactone decarboxylase family protein [Mucisphaera calidilacus]QDU72341.1 Alkyl hydroperoxide reductase AhpD [Mucisphaera calidilacus]